MNEVKPRSIHLVYKKKGLIKYYLHDIQILLVVLSFYLIPIFFLAYGISELMSSDGREGFDRSLIWLIFSIISFILITSFAYYTRRTSNKDREARIDERGIYQKTEKDEVMLFWNEIDNIQRKNIYLELTSNDIIIWPKVPKRNIIINDNQYGEELYLKAKEIIRFYAYYHHIPVKGF